MAKITPGYKFSEEETISWQNLNLLVADATVSEVSIDDIDGLAVALQNKADAADVAGRIEQKADIDHTHVAADVAGLEEALSKPHAHAISHIAGLGGVLAGKAASGHTHAVADIDGAWEAINTVQAQSQAASGMLSAVSASVQAQANSGGLDTKAERGHGHVLAEVFGLQARLDNKALSGHDHDVGAIDGFQQAIQRKAAAGHSHNIDAVSGLQDALNKKSASHHTHAASEIDGMGNAHNFEIARWRDENYTARAAKSTDQRLKQGVHTIADVVAAVRRIALVRNMNR